MSHSNSQWPTEIRLMKDKRTLCVSFEDGSHFHLAAEYLRVESPSAEVKGHSPAERRLYLVLGDGKAMRYGIGVAREGFEWAGTMRISMKREWPDWTPPAEMLRRRPELPRHMAGGPDNPLGARAMYLGSSLYRIHGSNEPETIGEAVSSGCIRMANEDVIDLYERVKIGTVVVVQK